MHVCWLREGSRWLCHLEFSEKQRNYLPFLSVNCCRYEELGSKHLRSRIFERWLVVSSFLCLATSLFWTGSPDRGPHDHDQLQFSSPSPLLPASRVSFQITIWTLGQRSRPGLWTVWIMSMECVVDGLYQRFLVSWSAKRSDWAKIRWKDQCSKKLGTIDKISICNKIRERRDSLQIWYDKIKFGVQKNPSTAIHN